jgi:ubiquinone/menaquinone biosynthesis C-methylase UbiE
LRQEDIWKEHVRRLTVDDVVRFYENPSVFQVELTAFLDRFADERRDVIEVGCETGVTSLLLSDSFNKTLLDINPAALSLARQAAERLGKHATFVEGDMFSMPFPDDSFDLVFNSGVLEHFGKKAREQALVEYARVLRDDGVMVIAFPNHHSLPYRSAYVVRANILAPIRRRYWPYPKEKKLYDLADESRGASLELQERLTMSKASLFKWWAFYPPGQRFFERRDARAGYEGYLTVLVFKKRV